MEIVLLSLLMAWGAMRYAGTDAIAAARGTESPRTVERRERAAQAHERAMARMSQRTGPTVGEAIGQRIADRIANPRGPREPGPARRAMAEWWSDSWGYATDRRRRRHERAANGQLGRQRAARAAGEWARNLRDRGRGTNEQAAPAYSKTAADHEDIVDAEIVTEPVPTVKQPETSPAGPGEAPRTSPDVDGPPNTESAKDTEPATVRENVETAADGETTDQAGDPTAPSHSFPDPATLPAALPAARTAPDPLDGDTPLASIHPIREDIHTMTTTEHTMTSGETLDPQAGLTFCEDMYGLAQKMYLELELSVATLESRGVSGAPIDLLSQMKEAAQVLAGHSESAKSHFERHVGTQDVVLSDDTLAGTVEGQYLGTRS